MHAVSLKTLNRCIIIYKIQNSYPEVGLWKIILQMCQQQALSQELEVFLLLLSLFMFLSLLFKFLVAAPRDPATAPHTQGIAPAPPNGWEAPGRWTVEPSQHPWYRTSHGLTHSQSAIGLCQKGKRCHVHLPCFFTEQANLNIAYYHNLSRIKIAQNKWQMAGSGALCQEMAKGRGKMGFWDGLYGLK